MNVSGDEVIVASTSQSSFPEPRRSLSSRKGKADLTSQMENRNLKLREVATGHEDSGKIS